MTGVILLCISNPAVSVENTPENAEKSRQALPTPQQEEKENSAVDQDRGQILYENHCRTCHESIVHIRDNRRAKTIDDIRYWVMRWSGELKLQWKTEDVDAVVNYLNLQYYKFKRSTELE